MRDAASRDDRVRARPEHAFETLYALRDVDGPHYGSGPTSMPARMEIQRDPDLSERESSANITTSRNMMPTIFCCAL